MESASVVVCELKGCIGSNPAVVAARPYLSQPRFIEAHRLGTFPERSLDIDVVFDWPAGTAWNRWSRA